MCRSVAQSVFFFNDTATTEIYTLSLHDALPIYKNVVLEEFTGLHCVYCPDGHVIAQSIYNAYPQRVSLINVHVGSYAQPSFGEPDFRTVFGSSLSAQSNLSGYPAGTINKIGRASCRERV
mgnify:CR=1 FL=1